MNEVARLPGVCSVCEQRAPIASDISARVSFRLLPGEVFLFAMKLCQECNDLLGLSVETAREVMAAAPEESPMCPCGADAQVMTSNGYRCRKCIKK